MKNYHITPHGPGVCTAELRECPYGDQPHKEHRSVVEAFKWASYIYEEQEEAEAKAWRARRKPTPRGPELCKMVENGERVHYRQIARAYPYASVESVEWLEKQWAKPQVFGNLRPGAALDAFELGSWRSLGRD